MKNLLFPIIVLLATSTRAIAQLYVAPNATADTYIYVKNIELYVDGTIELTANNAGPTEASIYLRDDAQLIQGGTNDTNSGTGFISVYQEGIADSYDYNVWSSPVSQPVGIGNQNYGRTILNQELGFTEAAPAIFVGGFNGSTLGGTLDIAEYWIYRMNIPGQNFVNVGTGNSVTTGQGFIMKGTNVTNILPGMPETNRQRYDFRGRPNSGDITVPLPMSSTGTTSPFDGGEILIGNPYPSALDLNLFFYDPANNGNNGAGSPDTPNNKFNVISFYDEDRTINSHLYIDNKAGYGIWTPGDYQPIIDPLPINEMYNPGNYVQAQFQNFDNDGIPIDNVTGPLGTGAAVDRRMAPIGQGFFIQSVDIANNDDITFSNSQRRFIKEGDAPYNSEFRNPEGGEFTINIGGDQTDPTDPQDAFFAPQIRINTYMGVSHMRQSLLILHNTATDDFDNGWDGLSPMDATSEMYFPLQTSFSDEIKYPFIINAIPFDDISKQVPFTLQIEEEMNVIISGIEEIDLPIDDIYVWDSIDNTFQNITGGDSASFFLKAGTYTDRFFIVFERDAYFHENRTSTNGAKNGELTSTVSFFQNNRQTQLEISNPDTVEISTAAIFDMRGRLVLNQQNLGNSSNFTFNTGTFSDGTYIVILTTPDNQIIDYKIIVANK